MKNFYNIYIFISYLIQIGVGILITFFCGHIFFNTDNLGKIVIVPFIIAGISVIISGISNIVKALLAKKAMDMADNGYFEEAQNLEMKSQIGDKGNVFARNLYIFSFSLFWFGFLIVFDYLAIKSWNDGGKGLFLYSLIFWGAGIYMLYSNLKKH